MSRLDTLKAAKSLSDVARLLGFKPKNLAYILYKLPGEAKYTTFQIPKRNGGQRTVKAPAEPLKLLQRRLSILLQDCVDKINSVNQRNDRTAHGFMRNRSIITNAHQHRNRRWVFNIDLENFFDSINFGRVRGFLLKNRNFELQKEVATVIAQIACHENSLPQGSPCSPVISNLVAHLLDMKLVKLASKAGCTYTRYADDLTFSTNKREFPADIAMPSGSEGAACHKWLPGQALRKIIERSGFRINDKKTHQMYRVSRQNVTGLVVNKRINVRQEYRHSVRAMVHHLVRTGIFEILGVTHNNGNAVLKRRPGNLNELHGMLGFIESIDVHNKTPEAGARSDERSSIEKDYKKFLLYSTFYAAEAPVIICEGETDNVYLTHAIRSLAKEFPVLVDVQTDKKIRLKVRLLKYTRSSTARLLNLNDGGSSVLSAFIGKYKTEIGKFAAPGPKAPVIILYDNDDGAKAIKNAIKGVCKETITGQEPFIHIHKNLYAVPTPGNPSKIEDFFEDSIKKIPIDGKTFNPDNSIDPDKHYGKKVFAHKVVRPDASKIDFSLFRPLLTNLTAAIEKHKEQFSPG